MAPLGMLALSMMLRACCTEGCASLPPQCLLLLGMLPRSALLMGLLPQSTLPRGSRRATARGAGYVSESVLALRSKTTSARKSMESQAAS